MTSMTTLKPICRGAFLLLVLALRRQPALAQASETAAPPRPASTHSKRPTLDDRVAVLSKNLELTDAQRSAVKKILEQRQQQTVRIRESEAPGNVRIEQFRALQERTVAQIRAVLTDEQKKKYDPLLPRTRPAPSTPQRSVEDWIKATTPH
jgi:Spy/CpxP family protein refolding chaperone